MWKCAGVPYQRYKNAGCLLNAEIFLKDELMSLQLFVCISTEKMSQ